VEDEHFGRLEPCVQSGKCRADDLQYKLMGFCLICAEAAVEQSLEEPIRDFRNL
jgi:hypothetical protein